MVKTLPNIKNYCKVKVIHLGGNVDEIMKKKKHCKVRNTRRSRGKLVNDQVHCWVVE